MTDYVPTIGLEIHAELKTRTKMFCLSKNDPDETRPNVNICPVCLAHPGTLPVINREAVRHVLRVGVALGGRLADYTEFDRKNYFYPDLPKGYQISQYEFPLVSGGELHGVAITRVHLEEDTASSIHNEGEGTTAIDFNRSGVPLMELVTEPVIRSAAEAGTFARELQLLLRYLDASEANMEKGEMRVEANVSVSRSDPRSDLKRIPRSDLKLGTKVEIKNLNSFKAMERAIEYETKRQTSLLERGDKVVQETRGWDEAKQATFPQRTKEGSADYRYFPDPDLPSLRISEVVDFSTASISTTLAELPWARRERYIELGIKGEDASILTADSKIASFFDKVLVKIKPPATPQSAANYVTNDLVNLLRDTGNRDAEHGAEIPITAENFAKIVTIVAEKKISSRVAKDLISLSLNSEKDPEEIAKEQGLFRVQESTELGAIVEKILADHVTVADDYKRGKASALEYLVGQGMRQTRGAADPEVLREMIRSKIG